MRSEAQAALRTNIEQELIAEREPAPVLPGT